MAKRNRIAKRKKNFTQISNQCLYDERLSLKAKGLLCLLSSFKEDWNFYDEYMLGKMTDQRSSFATAKKALQETNYIKVFQVRYKGRFSNRIIIIDDEGVEDLPQQKLFELYNVRLRDGETVIFNPRTVRRKPVNGKTVNGSSANGKTATSNTHTNHTSKSNTDLNYKYLSESSNPIMFRKMILDQYLGRALCTPGKDVGFASTTVISVSPIGYLHNEVSNKDLSPDDAQKVWKWAFHNQDKLFSVGAAND